MIRHASDLLRTVGMKLTLGLLAVTMPLIALLVYINFYAIRVVKEEVTASNRNLLSLYMGQIDRSLEEIEKFLLNTAAQETSLLQLERPAELDADRYNLARSWIFRLLSEEIGKYKEADFFFVYSSLNDDAIYVPGDLTDTRYALRQAVRTEFTARVLRESAELERTAAGRWLRFEAEDQRFLFHVFRSGSVYLGALVNVEKMMVPLTLIDLGSDGSAYLDTAEEEPPSEDGRDSYLTVRQPSSQGDFSLNVRIPEDEVLQNLPLIRQIVSFIASGALAIYAATWLFIRRVVWLPIQRIVAAMKRLRSGLLDTRLEAHSSSVEFELMNETFNSMANQIENLKISVYEEQLNHQKAILKHLQLQINPHFFLNSLNIIYYMAQAKEFRLIQEMAHCLIEYFRFMFRSNSDYVSLNDEMRHTENYLRIQEMRFPNNLAFRISFDPQLGDCRVPPLVIQTFAENAVKYAVSTDRHTEIGIRASLSAEAGGKTGGKPMLCIRIEDNGPGFPQEVLRTLQEMRDPKQLNGEKIGIANICKRLDLLYPNRASISFRNREEGGAVVEIALPYEPMEEAT